MKGAAHLISAIKKDIPVNFLPSFKAGELYLYLKLNLEQTFINTWFTYSQDKRFLSHSAAIALLEVLPQDTFTWVMNIAPSLTSTQSAILEAIPVSTENDLFLALKVWNNLNAGIKAEPLLDRIPQSHSLKIPMARSVMLGYLKIRDVAGAGKILKQHLEPAINKMEDVTLVGEHYLTIARLLYQVGMLEESKKFYQKIPNNTEDFLKAQTELAWVLLRTGQTGQLKGLLTTLGNDLFVDVFNPEVFLVRSIANLKLCRYKDVQKDFNAFIKVNTSFGRQISLALKNGHPPPEGVQDYYISLHRKSLTTLDKEIKVLDELAQESINAVLPSVGIQPHWKRAKTKLAQSREWQSKNLQKEYGRFWKNRELVLSEAIRKMRFVKVELMSQLNEFKEKNNVPGSDKVSFVQSALQKNNQQVFPFDNIVWSDEMFNLYTEAESFCLSLQKSKV